MKIQSLRPLLNATLRPALSLGLPIGLGLGLALAGLTSTSPASAAIPDEITLQAGNQSKTLTLPELKKLLPTVQVQLSDPVYSTPRKWDAFKLEDILKLLGKTPDAADEIIFQAADGYAPSVARAKLVGHPAFLAYQEHGRKGRFEKVPQGKAMISPAPFFLLWADGKTIGEEYPWPYQLVKIEFVSFHEKYAKIFPGEKDPASPEMRGFVLFKNECIRCHSINLVGGDIGPELNIPKNVLEYWDQRTLHDYVQNASNFHARSKMPAFPQLTDGNIDDIFAYFHWAKDHKQQ
jgi:mono/diheme cytochrome c family protein